MSLSDLLKANRSYRGYLQSPRLSRDDLSGLVALTRLCPSSSNLQALKFFISADDETNAKIQPLTGWAKKLKNVSLPHPGCCPTSFIVILLDLNISTNATAFARDAGIAAQTILLGAAEKGFGGCMIGSFQAEPLCQALALPENLKPMLVLALGKPGETIELHDAPAGFVTAENCYSRDENDVHHVWKRPLEEIVIS